MALYHVRQLLLRAGSLDIARAETTFRSDNTTVLFINDMLRALGHCDDVRHAILDAFSCHASFWKDWHKTGARPSVNVKDLGLFRWELKVICDHREYDREFLLYVADHFGQPYSAYNPQALNGLIITDRLREMAENIVVNGCDET